MGKVSAPVTKDELPDVEMRDFTIATMPGRFAELGDRDRVAAKSSPGAITVPILTQMSR